MVQQSMIRHIREQRSETISSMAKKLGIGASRYYMIENGERPATPELALAIARILGVETETLFLPQSFTARQTKEATDNA